jgi:hypothetical protein
MKPAIFLTLLIVLLSACAPALTATPVSTQPLAVAETPTRLLSTAETPSATPTTSETPTISPTSTITPLPTIPTFTPTFDVRTIVTATPAPKAECPQTTVVLHPNVAFLDFSFDKQDNRANAEKNLLDFLNQHGLESLKNVLHELPWINGRDYAIKDFTNDGVPDLILRAGATYIFGCVNGEYGSLLVLHPDGQLMAPAIESITDANRNNVPEIIFLTAVQSQGGRIYGVYEWNGKNFSNLIPSKYLDAPDEGEISIEVTGKIYYQDVDHDALMELVTESGIPLWSTYYDGLPLRNETTYYKWNRKQFVPAKIEFAQPEFRFQAIQDGDLAVSQQEYAKALDLYQRAVFNEKLKYYSPEIRKNLQENWVRSLTNDQPSPTPAAPDPTEYPRLAAYAYYRMVILHTFLGETEAAQVKYATLQEKFPVGSPGHPYVEMANAFWDAYQSSGKMYRACAASIAYADAHPEILIPLGSDYHGWQSHKYVAADVCPFR